MSTHRKQLGNFGERLAKEFLCRKGYTFIAAGMRSRFGEIDLLMKDRDLIVIVEVKLSTSEQFGRPEERVTWKKRQKLLRTWWSVRERVVKASRYRIDVVSILINSEAKTARVRHFQNIET
ncbi:MAG: YraN family protein [Candidatus Kerfeldbacteria bacterium]|nr:YraN family protein [Candidatus Kerfeldbacteria bacterium]